ncbi:DNA polymerase/3'-5' exonuclease PolX [Calidithermus roseus]|uniref:DNA-directed DNA polymerase n=1 Tax=Calidithermus roseus TaxID=1644118 RepID=A0A399EK65_9DEIN|nr:DNA polymerase/3'-5' exonuclease PolX [Calidithermus roseus]RIH85114.1 DNA polymerase/3'-5' exonuclease PolX [Calidithermus roseus]
MNRKELAGMLEYAADLMEVLGEGEFRAQAYRRAARNIEKLEADLEVLAAQGFKGVPGVGPALAPMLTEIVQSGEFAYMAELEAQVPPGVLEFFRVQGLGPKRIRALWEHGIDSLEELIRHGEAGRLQGIPGFGAKTEANLVQAARFALEGLRRVLWGEAIEAAELLLADFAGAGIRAEVAGSFRRGLETIGNLDFVALAGPEAVQNALGRYIERIEGSVLHGHLGGLPLKVFCATPQDYGTVLLRATGSRAFVESLGELPVGQSEAEVFEQLGRRLPSPYWREPEHLGLEEPEQALRREDLLGLIHCHSTYSDGTASLRTMAEAAIAEGYSYMVITDHSQSAPYAGGLEPQRVKAQWAEIERLNVELAPFRILKGIESDILPDGSLDYPDEMLAGFDVVIGSLHSGLNLPKEEQTQRLLRALDNPHLKILGHPTGRLLLRRKGAEADWERVLERAAERGVAVEINCNHHRCDLDWRLALQWRDRLRFSLGTDAHSLEGLPTIAYGLILAAKAGLSKKQVVNAWKAETLSRAGS